MMACEFIYVINICGMIGRSDYDESVNILPGNQNPWGSFSDFTDEEESSMSSIVLRGVKL